MNQAGAPRSPCTSCWPIHMEAIVSSSRCPLTTTQTPREWNRDREVNNDKGFLELSGGIQFMLGSKPVMPLSARLVAFVKENEAKQEEDLRYYLGSTVALCKGLGYRWQVIKDINAYVHTNAL